MNDPALHVQARLAEVLAVHFDPETGSRYWLERSETLGFDPRADIKTVDDLPRFGLMDQDALRRRPLTDFIPRSLQRHPQDLIVVRTGGTLGRPLWTAYLDEEYHAAFVTPFVVAADHVGFPAGGLWLFVGPSGPHVIGRAAESIARATGSPAPFMVDFDAGWAKRLPAGSFAARRYLQHVVDQATAVIETQTITVLFSTPTVLEALSQAMTPPQWDRIRGVHYGGMEIAPETLRRFQVSVFPNAVHLCGYGNTLFGCCLEMDVSAGRELRYFPHGDRLILGQVLEGEGGTPDIRYRVADSPATLVFSRLDRAALLLNVAERDRGRLLAPPAGAPPGFHSVGVASPTLADAQARRAIVSLY